MKAAIDFAIGVEVADENFGITAVLGESCKATRKLIEQVRDALV